MTEERNNGIVVGLVTNLVDPENRGRVKVEYPRSGEESDWARLVSPMAGKQRGLFLRPEVGDEVLVAFELGDPREAYVLGGVWSETDPPPADDGKAEENNWRFLRSRSGHLVKLDDTEGSEVIEIVDKDGERKVIIDSAGQKIQVICDSGDVEVTAGAGTVKVEAQNVEVEAQNVEVKAQAGVKVEAPSIEVKAKSQMTLDGGASLTLSGGVININ